MKSLRQSKLNDMIRRIDLRESVAAGVSVTNMVPRAATNVADASKIVAPILEDIRENGAEAVARWSLTLDGIAPPSLRVPAEELKRAAENLDPAVRAALLESIRRARIVHLDQVRGESETVHDQRLAERLGDLDELLPGRVHSQDVTDDDFAVVLLGERGDLGRFFDRFR